MAVIIFRMMASMEEVVQAMAAIVMKRIMDIILVAEKSSGGGGGAWIAIAIVVIGSIVGAMNELIGAILMIVLAFIVIMSR